MKNYKEIFTNFYLKYNPTKVDGVEDILKKYKGEEEFVFERMCKKYNVNSNIFLNPDLVKEENIIDEDYISMFNATFPTQKPIYKKPIFILLGIIGIVVAIYYYVDLNTSKVGSLKGRLNFPSDNGIPAMKVFIKESKTNKIYTILSNVNQDTFIFKNVPVGNYLVYAYALDDKGKILSEGAGYTPAVGCGLSVDCPDHSLIEVAVKSNEVTDSINIYDWYGALLPESDFKTSNEISNYFLPELPYTRVDVVANVEKIQMYTQLLYTKEDDFNVKYTNTHISNEQATISSISIEKYKIENNEVRLYEKKSQDLIHNKIIDNKYAEPLVVLKLPVENLSVLWIYSFGNGQEEHCTAEWSHLKISGKSLKCIKVVRSTYLNGKCMDNETGKKIEYYAFGYGFVQSKIFDTDKNEILPFNNFEKRQIK